VNPENSWRRKKFQKHDPGYSIVFELLPIKNILGILYKYTRPDDGSFPLLRSMPLCISEERIPLYRCREKGTNHPLGRDASSGKINSQDVRSTSYRLSN
jgi:hypothetical protein